MIQNTSKGQMTAQVSLGDQLRSGFRFDYPFRGSGRLGRIYNTRATHVYPSDNVTSNSIAALQFEPLAVPILANMYVHQEHFYVPENTLWDEFDKFFSGGVKMDYHGKKPSMSLQKMWRCFFDYLTQQGETPFLDPISITKTSDTDFVITAPQIAAMENYVMQFRSLLEDAQMLDLFEYIEDAIHDCGKYLNSIMQDNKVILFKKGIGLDPEETDNTDFTDYYNELNPNKYLRKIYKSVLAAFDAANNGGGREYIIPTPEGMQFLNYLYEVFKPFFGYSSYLDNMNYNKITFDNFVYLFVLTFIDPTINPLVFEDDLEIYLDRIIESMAVNMSEYPQEILKLRAQYSVWWNNYRDQLLEQDAMEPVTTSAIIDKEIVVLLAPRVRCWHKDTFTTALDNPGTGSVGVPTNAYKYSASTLRISEPYIISKVNQLNNDINYTESNMFIEGNNIAEISIGGNKWSLPTGFLSGINPLLEDDNPLSENVGFSLYALDAAKRAQKWLQRALFYGNRIQDFLYTHFGVKYLDARLRLPELLGTSKQLVRLTDVINNTNVKSEDGTVAIAGDRAAIAHAYDENGGSFERYCEECGYIISNLTVMPDVTYANVFDRDNAMLDQFDYPFPEFATLGMDAVYDVELAQMPVKVMTPEGGLTDAPNVFGYQGRYYSVKSKLGEEHGELLDTQDMYTFARDFNIYDPDKRPKLNYIFVHCHPVLDMFVVDNTYSDYFRFDIYFNSGANRPYPAHSLII